MCQIQRLLIFCLAAIMIPSCYLTRKSCENNEEVNVIAASNEGLEQYLSLIPEGQEEYFGFENREDFLFAETGRAYELHTLTPEFFETGKINQGSYIMPLNEWLVSVETHGEANTLLTVSMKNDAWQTVGIGAANLAKELNYFDKHHIFEEEFAGILRIPQLKCDMLIVQNSKQPGAERVYFLESARVSMGVQTEPGHYFSLQEALEMTKLNITNTE